MFDRSLRIGCILLALPGMCLAASSARSELDAALRAQADSTHGEALFAQCTQCHGPRGGGDPNGSTPRIAGQHYRVIVKQLVDFRYGKRWDFRMEGMADRHHLTSAQEIADVAAFVSALDRPGDQGLGSGEGSARGQAIYAGQCQSCHGPDAAGDDATATPRLAGQHYGYLLRQMYDAVDGRRPALPRLHAKRIAPLDFDEVRAVSDYLSRIGAAPQARDPGPPPPR
jgi:cytochrome c553